MDGDAPTALSRLSLTDRIAFRLRGTAPVRHLYRGKRNRSADTFVLSFPKCGRTWLRILLGKAIADHHGITGVDFGELPQLAEQAPGLPVIRFKHDDNPHFKTPDELVRRKTEYRDRPVVLLVRDVRDTVVSAYFQMTRREQKYRFEGDIDAFARSDRGGARTLVGFYNAWARQHHIPPAFLLSRYEDLHADPHAELRRLLEFVGLPDIADATLDAAVEFASFGNMRKMEVSGDAPGRLTNAETDGSDPEALKTRKGKVGGYAGYLRPDTVDWLNNLIDHELDPVFGYRSDRLEPAALTKPVPETEPATGDPR